MKEKGSLSDMVQLPELGTVVADVILSGERQEPERHVMVGGQVRGYLRWFGDLSEHKGYWPLAESISQGLICPGAEREALTSIVDLFAKDWKCSSISVRTAINGAMKFAVALHPDFASQVLGGLSRPYGVLAFVQASVRWLTCHRLTLTNEQQEAFWQLWPICQSAQSAQYISNEDYQIVCAFCAGKTFHEIALDLDYSVEEISNIYQQTVDRANSILCNTRGGPSVGERLKSLGFLPWMSGTRELETAVRLAYEDHSLLDGNATDVLFPAVAKELGITEGQVPYRIKKVIDEVYNDNRAGYKNSELKGVLTHEGSKRARIQLVVASLVRYIEAHEHRN